MKLPLLIAAGTALLTLGQSGIAQTPPETVPGIAPDVTALATPRTLTTQFTYTATVLAPPAGTKTLDVWLPLPSDSPWQKVSDVSVQAPIASRVTREAKYGNRMVALHEDAPTGPLSVTVRFTVARKEVRVLDTPAGAARPAKTNGFPAARMALAADRRVPVGGRFQDIAKQVTRGKTTATAKERALFDSVEANLHYDYKKQSPEYAQGDAAFVCDYKSGNCSDLHSYLIALSRSVGVPAVLEFGFPLTGIPISASAPTDGTIPGYHCWTWFDDPQHGWTPEDAADARRWDDAGHPEVSRYLFGDLVLERSAVAMSRGRDLTLSPPQKGGPLNYFIYPYAEADGKTTDASWTLSYHIVSRTP